MRELVVVMPVHNEGETIAETVLAWIEMLRHELGSSAFSLLLVDDGSTDSTRSEIERCLLLAPELEVHSQANGGHGQACGTGYRLALESGASWILQVDSDGQCDPGDFAKVWERRLPGRVVLGVRWRRQDGISRWVISRWVSLIVLVRTGTWLPDSNVPFRLMPRELLRCGMDSLPSKPFFINILLSVFFKRSRAVDYAGIRFLERARGASSIRIGALPSHASRLVRELRHPIPERRSDGRPWILLGVAYLAMRFQYLDFVPIWDGWGYYGDLKSAVSGASGFWKNASLAGHPSTAWAVICSLPIRFFPASIPAFNSYLLGLQALAIVAFAKLVKMHARPDASPWECALATACFAFHPVLLATSINFSLDTGLLVLFPIQLWLWSDRKWLAAGLVGALMALTKETGIVIALFLPGMEILRILIIRDHEKSKLFSELKRPLAPLAMPILAFGIYLLFRRTVSGQTLVWRDNPYKLVDCVLLFLLPFKNPRSMFAFAQLAFVVNFGWVATCSWVALLVAKVLKRATASEAASTPRGGLPLLPMLLATTYLVVRIPTFMNVRYVAPVIPLLILLIWRELGGQVRRPRLRIGFLGLLLATFLVADYSSLDPISIPLMGRFRLDEADLFQMEDLMQGPGRSEINRDQLVYNLQFTAFSEVVNAAFTRIRPTDQTVITAHHFSVWEDRLLGDIDPANYHRSDRVPGSIHPVYVAVADLVSQVQAGKRAMPETVWYIELPNFDSRGDLKRLNEIFLESEPVETRLASGASFSIRHFWGLKGL